MKTVLIGAGAGCRAILELAKQGRLSPLSPEIIAVADVDPDAAGLRIAEQQGWTTCRSVQQALELPELELVVELTGDDEVLTEIQRRVRPGVRVIDHLIARLIWDLDESFKQLREELGRKAQRESKALAERAHLEKILDALPDQVMVVDRERRIVNVNRRFEEASGRSRADARTKHCWDAVCAEGEQAHCSTVSCPVQDALETKQSVTQVHDDGLGGYHQVIASPILDDLGEVTLIVKTSREITEQIRLQRDTAVTARRFDQIVKAVHGIITIRDLKGRYVLANPRAEAVFKRPQAQWIGKQPAELFDDQTAAVIERGDERVRADGKHHVCEEVYCIDGRRLVLVAERFPLCDYKGDVVAICCVARDETKQQLLQQELLQTERLAAIGKLAAGVAHELNNPLTGVLTFAEDLLLDAAEGDPRRDDYETIVSETLRCRRIVRDLLDFSRQKAPQRRPLEVNPVVRRTVAMVERQASFHNVDITVELAPDLPEVSIDSGQIQQAILNLLVNARDAMDGHGPLTVRSFRQPDDGAVVVAVQDAGCGINTEQQRQIFEPFFSTKGERGNGLGLPAVVGVMDQHDGRVELSSEVGVGSTFRLVFPVSGAAKERHEQRRRAADSG